jgi:hypothetical protein
MKTREGVMKIRYQEFFRNWEGEIPVIFLKKALKFAGSEKPSWKPISFAESSVK